MHTDHSNPQRDLVANALVLLLKNLDPNLDPTHFAKHTPLKAEIKNSHDAAAFIKDCSHEFGVNLTTPEAREEAQWALAGTAAPMNGHHEVGNGSVFAFADFILKRLEMEGKTYSSTAFVCVETPFISSSGHVVSTTGAPSDAATQWMTFKPG
ncbi:hypothetical protein OPT61_g6211 [Boeremia exigua]|uniref:Uncharacterized protein n=1 Tax=Boeremia exigua TaxID=749465 RepID=A0ACC2I7E9_9PLEO|nr:hypothetical protein OPT61_g6211 [Boeremia exigua]